MHLRPRAEALSFKGTKVLACYSEAGYVCFPGGGIDPHESAVQAAKRECLEEADRQLINCSVAHPPSVQVWPEGYAKGKPWAEKCNGGITYWMVGSTSDDCLHVDPANRHADYEAGFDWKPLDEVIRRLSHDMGGDWSDDVKVRLSICQAHVAMHKPRITPKLSALRLPLGAVGS